MRFLGAALPFFVESGFVMLVETKFPLGPHQVRLQTGEIARQATGAVRLDISGLTLLATVVAAPEPKQGQSFFPLTVDYIEKTYAAGFIPRGFTHREGMPREAETLTARLIDRSLRPLFPKWFRNEVHVVIHVLSADPQIDPDIPALLASAAAIRVAGLPFDGPVAGLRMAYLDERLSVNPPRTEQERSALDLVVSATPRGVVMIEAQADDLPEPVAIMAIAHAQAAMGPAWEAMESLAQAAGKAAWIPSPPPELTAQEREVLDRLATPRLRAVLSSTPPAAPGAAVEELLRGLVAELQPHGFDPSALADSFASLRTQVQREILASTGRRMDGRTSRQVRPLEMRSGVLPRTHGSALFTRGETQALAVVTLGTEDEAQVIEGLAPRRRERFLLHYNMPPFAVGETGRMGPAKRRELGHGRLARRALAAVIPSASEFPYVIRLVSEILEANGSSSMATVCGGCLALSDAGVPLKDLVAGVAMGASSHGGNVLVLTDITEDEDHLGDMDFKVAGTFHGLTALQMDVKVPGVDLALIEAAMAQAKDARREILDAMRQSMAGEDRQLSPSAPGMERFTIDASRTGLVIGKGGATIRALCEETAARVDISKDGQVTVTAERAEQAREARRRIEALARAVRIGDRCKARVEAHVMFYGALLSLPDGTAGALHLAHMPPAEAAEWEELLEPGRVVEVEVIGADPAGRHLLSRLSLVSAPAPGEVATTED